MDNLDIWTRFMSNSVILTGVLYLKCSDELLTKRCLERGKSENRSDDKSDKISIRIETFKKETLPVINRFKSLKQLFEINTEKSIEEVQKEIDLIFSAQMFGFIGPTPQTRRSIC